MRKQQRMLGINTKFLLSNRNDFTQISFSSHHSFFDFDAAFDGLFLGSDLGISRGFPGGYGSAARAERGNHPGSPCLCRSSGRAPGVLPSGDPIQKGKKRGGGDAL
ncbi:MAG: hypothetical protein IJ214_12070 [Clostridia bacterium]|nr:hypothetical protein [Clostridia bacterium]